MTVDRILDSKIIVCAGSGGVGKTTISAAIALEAASRGRKTIVLTIDPAKRLADALGLKQLSNSPARIPASSFRSSGMDPMPLDAMMLDTKTTFDELVQKYARDPQRAQRIISNRFYQAISGALSGTHEYMAMEKLYELYTEGEYDVIVIDTPPTRNALDFLEAPKRMTSFLEGRLLRWFLIPAIGGGKGLFKALNFATVQFLKVVKRIVGAQVLEDTAEFFANFEGMYEGFKERAQEVYEVLKDPKTSFVVIASPLESAVREALFFAETLNTYDFNFGGLVINRTHPRFALPDIKKPNNVLRAALLISEGLALVSEREEQSLGRLENEIPAYMWARIPYFTEDITDLEGLRLVAAAVFHDSGL